MMHEVPRNSRLTNEQQAVVAHERGHARVSAVAGAGKTSTMIARVLQLLEKGTPASRILILMFNRSAREEFASRLEADAATGTVLPKVRTFHSLGMRLCQTLIRWGYIPQRELLNAEWQRERLARQSITEAIAEFPDIGDEALESEVTDAFLGFCDRVKGELTAPEILVEHDDFGKDKQYFPAAYHRHEQIMLEQGVMTYSDLLHIPLKTIGAFPELKERLSGFLDHIIIDEYQDINEAQLRLLSILVAPAGQVMAVGDANQCIYEWRGARVDAMLSRFEHYFGQPRDYPLSCTFRHGHSLALMANHAIEANKNRPDQITLATPRAPTTSIHLQHGISALVELLQHWVDGGNSLSESAVLFRSWSMSVPVQLALMKASIPFQLSREDRFVFRLPLVISLAGFLEVSEDPSLLGNADHLLMLFSQPTTFVARERLVNLCQFLAKTRQWPSNDSVLLAGIRPFQRNGLKKRWELVLELAVLKGTATSILLGKVVDTLEAHKVLRRAASRPEKGEEDVRLLDVLLEQAKEAGDDTQSFIDLLCQPIESNREGVVLSTVHGAKGLEWPLVALWGVNEEDFPLYSREMPLTPMALEAERRLYYVAVTRAKQSLVLFSESDKERRSRFLNESHWALCNHIGAMVDGREPIPQTPIKVKHPDIFNRYCSHFNLTVPFEAEPLKPLAWATGDWVEHTNFGQGKIERIDGEGERQILEVHFRHAGKRRLMATRAPITLCSA